MAWKCDPAVGYLAIATVILSAAFVDIYLVNDTIARLPVPPKTAVFSRPTAPKPKQPTLYEAARISAVRVRVGRTGGSGVSIAPRLFLTACHVVLNRDGAIQLDGVGSYPAKAQIVAVDEKRDRCVLEGGPRRTAPVRGVRSLASLKVGEPVHILSFPGGRESFTSGIITGLDAERGIIWTDAKADFGSSGGGLFDCEGVLVGIIRGTNQRHETQAASAENALAMLRR